MHSSGARPIHSHRNSLPDVHSPNGTNGYPAGNGPMAVPSRPPGINGTTPAYGARGPPNGPAANSFMSKSPPNAPNQKSECSISNQILEL